MICYKVRELTAKKAYETLDLTKSTFYNMIKVQEKNSQGWVLTFSKNRENNVYIDLNFSLLHNYLEAWPYIKSIKNLS